MGMSLKQIRYLYAIGVFKRDGSKDRLKKSIPLTGLTKRQASVRLGKIGASLSTGEVSTTHRLRIGDTTYPIQKDRNGSSYPAVKGKTRSLSDLPDGPMSIERINIKAKKGQKRVAKVDSPKPEVVKQVETTKKASTKGQKPKISNNIEEALEQLTIAVNNIDTRISRVSKLSARIARYSDRVVAPLQKAYSAIPLVPESKENKGGFTPEKKAAYQKLQEAQARVRKTRIALEEWGELENFRMHEGLTQFNDQVIKQFQTPGKPDIVSRSSIDIPIYRGIRGTNEISTKELVDQLKSGDTSLRSGIFGAGLYFTSSEESGKSYSTMKDREDTRVITAGFKSDVRLIDHDEISDIRSEALSDSKYGSLRYLDESAFAAALGYDAVQVRFTPKENYFVVLNPAKLKVAK